MASDPKCPECSGSIGADWDWCMHCGYDPDHLKPWDWQPGAAHATSGSLKTATAKGGVDLIDLTDQKRRSKRSGRPKRKGRSKAERPEPKPATMATTSGLISLPPRPTAPTSRKAPIPPANPGPNADPASAPAPAVAPPVAPAAAAAAEAAPPLPSRQSAAPPRPEAKPEPAFDMTSPLVQHTYAPIAPQAATRTVALPRTTLSLIPVVVLFVLSGLMLFVAFSSMAKLGEGSVLSRSTTVLFVLVCLALACGMAAQGYTFMKVRVEIGPNEIVAHNRFGRPSKARICDIFSITMGTRRYLDVPLIGRPAEAPYVQMQDGSGFWLDALEGRDGEPPAPEQLAVIEALGRTVAANRNEARRNDAPGNLI
jgi:hypothetical protein